MAHQAVAVPAAVGDGVAAGVPGEVKPSACQELAAPKPKADCFGTRLQLCLPSPDGWTADDAAQKLLEKLRPAPAWVFAALKPSGLEFIAVWSASQQPNRQALKANLHTMLDLDATRIQDAFKLAKVAAWRFDAVTALQRMHQAATDAAVLSKAGLLNDEKLVQVRAELKGLPSWGDRDKDMATKAAELMNRHVYGAEDVETRVLSDAYFQADLLKRKGPENFVKDMKARVREAELKGQTLVTLCLAAAGEALPYKTAADLNGSGWQLTVMTALASPPHQIRGVLVLGPPRCGKSHIGHQLHAGLPETTVVKVQEAEQSDIYSFGTKLGPATVLLQIDEFECKTGLAKMKNLLEPHNEGFEIRTGPSRGRNTHTAMPANLRVLITSNWTKEELVRSYKRSGATEEDLDAFWERLVVVDLFAAKVAKRPRQQRQDLEPARVAATIVALAGAATLEFPRQAVPSSCVRGAPPSPPSPLAPPPKKLKCYSAPSKLARAAAARADE